MNSSVGTVQLSPLSPSPAPALSWWDVVGLGTISPQMTVVKLSLWGFLACWGEG